MQTQHTEKDSFMFHDAWDVDSGLAGHLCLFMQFQDLPTCFSSMVALGSWNSYMVAEGSKSGWGLHFKTQEIEAACVLGAEPGKCMASLLQYSVGQA